MADQIRLTATTRRTPELLQTLTRAELPADTWKRLCLAFLRRLDQTNPILTQLCAVEACDLAFSRAFVTPYRDEPQAGDLLGRGRALWIQRAWCPRGDWVSVDDEVSRGSGRRGVDFAARAPHDPLARGVHGHDMALEATRRRGPRGHCCLILGKNG
jgi:hypothetical protein